MKSAHLKCRVLFPTDDLSPVTQAIAALPHDSQRLSASPAMGTALVEHGESLFPGICWFYFEDESGPAALVPLQRVVDNDSALKTLSLRSLSRFEMLYADALIRADMPAAALGKAFLTHPVLERRCADVLRWRDLPLNSNLHRIVRGLPAEVFEREGTSVIPVGRSGNEWLASLSRNLRGQIRQSENRLRQRGALTIRAAEGISDMAAAFDRFVTLEATGYKLASNALVNMPADRAVLADTLLGHAQRGDGHVLEMYLDDQLVASQFGVVCGDRLYLIKVAFNEVHAEASPGTFLMADLLRRLADGGRVQKLDCCVRQKWHARWHPDIETNIVATIPNTRTLRGLLLRTARAVRAVRARR